jgi:serine/threonine protein kinase
VDPGRWKQLETLFDAALAQPAADRAAFLDRTCTDQSLRQEIQELLDQYENAGSFLDTAPVPDLDERTFKPGDVVSDRYVISRFIAKGGMGEVYQAIDRELDIPVALKTFRAGANLSEAALRRFKQEVLARKINDPHVCQIIDYGRHTAGGRAPVPYLTMEFIDGITLSQHLAAFGPFAPRDALPLVLGMIQALAAAHRAGIVHRDFKSSNVMLVNTGGALTAKVLDFGLARGTAVSSTLTHTGQIMGTPAYMAPEQFRGEASPASDVYALGVVMREMLTADRSVSPVPSPVIPEPWHSVIEKCLRHDPSARFTAVQQVAAALTGQDNQETQRITERFEVSRRRAVLIAISVLVFIGCAAALWIYFNRGHTPNQSALSWYAKGLNALHDGAYFTASKALEQAVAADDNFALAHARLAEAYSELDYPERASAELLKANIRAKSGHTASSIDALYLTALSLDGARKYSEALPVYRDIVTRADPGDRPGAWVDLGRSYERNRDIPKALECYKTAIKADPQFVPAFLRAGITYTSQQKTAEADEAFTTAEKLYNAMSNTEGLAEVYYQEALLRNNVSSNIAEANRLLNKSLELSRVTGNVFQEVKVLFQLSNVAYKSENVARAQEYAARGLQLARLNGAENSTARGLIELGSVAHVHGDLAHAEQYFTEAREFATLRKDARNVARAAFSLGSVYIQTGRDAEGAAQVESARNYFEQVGQQKVVADCLVLIGRARTHTGDFDGALKAFNELLKIAVAANNPVSTALAHEGMASTYFRREQYPEALREYRESYRLNIAQGNKLAAAYALRNSGEAFVYIGQYADASSSLAQSRALALAGGFNDLLQSVKLVEAELLLSQGDFSRAVSTAKSVIAAPASKPLAVCHAKSVLAGAMVASSSPHEAGESVKDALECSRLNSDTWLNWNAQFVNIEFLIVSGRYEEARKMASARADEALSTGRLESAYKAFMLAAIAAVRAGDRAKAQQFASRAVDELARYSESWPAEMYSTYAKRTDIARLFARFQRETGRNIAATAASSR